MQFAGQLDCPEGLKEEVKNALRYQSPGAKTDEYKLHDVILAKTHEQVRDFRRSKKKRVSDDVQTARQTHERGGKKAKLRAESGVHGQRKNHDSRKKEASDAEKRDLPKHFYKNKDKESSDVNMKRLREDN
ncbi:hypothetical protein PF011_g21584 [Phytophthora fragariae]|uniref:Uncharacterized protein n=1 Tax=Phytophthora fragariae TaxID=53985 RepID=A0A6A3IP52_9STRA|nr:hypothetical protein PF011_g21584 [Phytophthora fragariae]